MYDSAIEHLTNDIARMLEDKGIECQAVKDQILLEGVPIVISLFTVDKT